MASEALIEQLKNLSDEIGNIDKDRLLRASLGEEALQEDFAPRLEEIQRRFEFALQYASDVHDNQVQSILGSLEHIKSAMEEQANWSNVDYVAQRSQFLTNIDTYLEEIKEFWPPFITAAIESRGFLEDEGIRREYESTIDSIKKESESALQQVQSEAQKTIAEARDLAEQIENRARLTAARISVEEAQKQFSEAQTALDRQVKTVGVF